MRTLDHTTPNPRLVTGIGYEIRALCTQRNRPSHTTRCLVGAINCSISESESESGDNRLPLVSGRYSSMGSDLWAGCGDGLNVWNPYGELIGKILVDGGISNFCFAGPDLTTIIMLNEEKIFQAQVVF